MAKSNERNKPIQKVQRRADIPDFQSEEEEHTFWSTHELGKELLNAAEPLVRDSLPPPRKRTKNVAVRFDETTRQHVRALAARRHQGYQTLIKQFVIERLYEEGKRDATVG